MPIIMSPIDSTPIIFKIARALAFLKVELSAHVCQDIHLERSESSELLNKCATIGDWMV
jgi:hypothetical protein